jgi:hypothetical protein
MNRPTNDHRPTSLLTPHPPRLATPRGPLPIRESGSTPDRDQHQELRSSAASRAARVVGDGDRYASAQLVAGSARGQPRVDSSRSKVSVTGTRANPNVRGRAGVAGESRGIVVPREDSRVALALAPQFGEQLLVPGRDGSTAVHDRLSWAIRLMYLWAIVRILALSRYSGGARGRNLLGEEPLRIKRLLLPP